MLIETGARAPSPTVDPTNEAASLFERIGGMRTVNDAVESFYRRLVNDPVFRPLYTGAEHKVEMAEQKAYASYLLGGFPSYHGTIMHRVYTRLQNAGGLNDDMMARIKGHVYATLHDDLDLNDMLIPLVMSALGKALSEYQESLEQAEEGGQ